MMQDSTLNVIIKAKNEAGKVLDGFNNQLGKTTGMSNGAKMALAGIGIAAAGMAIKIGKDAVDAAVDFQASMSNIATLVDTSKESMDEMGKAVLEMSKEVPVSIADLTTALYDVRSAGISAEGAMNVLKQSAVLATAGLGTTQEATDILTSAINAFGLDAKQSDKWANVFFESVKAGKTTVAGLAQGFGQIAPLANAVGVKFEELMAITSAMTTSGLDASIAYTQVRATISNLQKPTKEMQEIFDKLHITNIQNEIQNKGLTETIRELTKATDGDNQMLAKAFGSVEALNAVMMLNNDTGKLAIELTKGMTDNVYEMDAAFQKQKETTEAQMKTFKNSYNIVLIQLGTVILPAVNKALGGMIKAMEWITSSETISTLKAVGNALKPIADLAGKVAGFMGKIVNSSYNPFNMVAEGLVGLGAIKGYATGGVVPGPKGQAQLAMVHGGETITPPGQGASININFNNSTITDDSVIDKIKKALRREMELKYQGAN